MQPPTMDGGEPPPEDTNVGPITMDAEGSELEASGALALALDQAAATGGLGEAAGGLTATPRGLAAPAGGLAMATGCIATSGGGLDAQARVVDGLPQPAEEATVDVVALARSLLPTVPHPAIEYNLPVLDVQR